MLLVQEVASETSVPFPEMPSPLGPPASLAHQTSMALFMGHRTQNLNMWAALGPQELCDFLWAFYSILWCLFNAEFLPMSGRRQPLVSLERG